MSTSYKTHRRLQNQHGFALLPVAIVIVVVASIALLISSETAMNVNNVASQSEKTRVQYVAQAALEHALWTANNSGCTGYTLPATSFGSNSYNATFTPADDSPVTIAATGTLVNGVSHTIMRNNAQIMDQSIKTTVLQPGPVAGIDTYIWDGAHKNTNFGITNKLELNNQSAERNILIRFDLSSLPSSANINSATLELYLNGGSGLNNGVIDVHRITQSWFEGVDDDKDPPTAPGATYLKYDSSSMFGNWSAPGGDYDPTPLATTTIPSLLAGWYQWDITDAAIGGPQSILAGNGVLLTASGGSVDKINFSSSDASVSTQAPKLTLTFNCECGQPCTVASAPKNLLFVVGNDTNLTSEEITHQTLIQSWGYAVELIDDDASQIEFDAAVVNNDVAFITNDITASNLNTKLVDATIGVVTSEDNLSDEFGMASSIGWESGTVIEINNNTHYITSSFAIGSLTVFPGSESLAYVTDTLSPDLEQLARSTSGPALVTLDAGAAMYGGGTAAGRRVQLPWGGSPSLEPNDLNVDGLTILQRALEWGAGASGTSTLPIAHWKLDETSGTIAVDSVGGNDGTLMNGPVWAAGKVDGGLSLDGNNDYIDVSSMNPISYDDFTVSAWYKSADSSVSDDEYIFEHNDNFTNEITFGPTDDGTDDRLRFGFARGGSATWDPHYGTSDIVDQQWHHVVGVRSAGRIKIYVDGVLESDGADAHAGFVVIVDGDGPFIGDLPGNTEQVHGILDDVRLYDRGLSDAEILDLFTAGGGGGGSPATGLLLVVGNASSPAAADTGRMKMITDWGYTVTLFDDGESQSAFDAAVASNHVVFVTSSVGGGTLADKLTGVNKGIVNEFPGMMDNFGFSSATTQGYNSTGFSSTAAGHFITTPFVGAPVTTFTAFNLMPVSSGTLAPGLQNLGSPNGAPKDLDVPPPGLSVLDTGALRWDGEKAPARRVHLPLGLATTSQMTADGLDIMKRSIEWAGEGATGGGGGGGCDGTFRDEFNNPVYSGSDGTLNWAGDWQEINESDGPTLSDERVFEDQLEVPAMPTYQLHVRDNDGGGEGVMRSLDLNGATSATLSFDYKPARLDNKDDYASVQMSASGISGPWSEVVRFAGPADEIAYQAFSIDISAYSSADTVLRIITSPNMGSSDYVFFDNIQIECK